MCECECVGVFVYIWMCVRVCVVSLCVNVCVCVIVYMHGNTCMCELVRCVHVSVMGGNVSLRFILCSPNPSVPQNVTLFGDKVFTEVIK